MSYRLYIILIIVFSILGCSSSILMKVKDVYDNSYEIKGKPQKALDVYISNDIVIKVDYKKVDSLYIDKNDKKQIGDDIFYKVVIYLDNDSSSIEGYIDVDNKIKGKNDATEIIIPFSELKSYKKVQK